jgi:long-chain fatty acid transport protein
MVTVTTMSSKCLLAAGLVSAIVGAAESARASGLLVARFGGEWGHPMSGDLWSMYYNPAGLSLLGGTKLALSGTFALRMLDYTRAEGAIDNILTDPDIGSGTPQGAGVAANSGDASLTNFLVSPFLGIGTDFGVEGLGVALGFYVPMGGQSKWDKAPSQEGIPGAEDGTQRWWVIEGSSRSMYATLAAGYRIEPLRLSIGLGVNVVFTAIDNLQARNIDGTDTLTTNGDLQEGRAHTQVSSIDLSLGAGLLWEPVDNLFIGLSYQSQPGFGEQRLTGTVDMILGGGPYPADPTIQAELRQSLPDVVRFGVRYGEPECWEVRAFMDWARWSVLEEQCVLNSETDGRSCDGAAPPGKLIINPRNWKDAWGVRAGGSWWPTQGIELVLGGGYDGTSVPDSMVEPAYYDAEKVSVTVGGKFDLVKDSFQLFASFSQIIYFDRDIDPRGRVPKDPNNPDAGTISDIESIGLLESRRLPDSSGLYKQSISVLEIGLMLAF